MDGLLSEWGQGLGRGPVATPVEGQQLGWLPLQQQQLAEQLLQEKHDLA